MFELHATCIVKEEDGISKVLSFIEDIGFKTKSIKPLELVSYKSDKILFDIYACKDYKSISNQYDNITELIKTFKSCVHFQNTELTLKTDDSKLEWNII